MYMNIYLICLSNNYKVVFNADFSQIFSFEVPTIASHLSFKGSYKKQSSDSTAMSMDSVPVGIGLPAVVGVRASYKRPLIIDRAH